MEEKARMEEGKIICNPKALPQDKVLALNYRNGEWEIGKVIALSMYWIDRNSSSFRYTVLLDRKSKAGNIIVIKVRDKGISNQQ